MKKIELRKINANKKEQIWTAEITNDSVIYTWGQVDGKMQKETRVFKSGKNVGRANETSPEEQCLFEACRKGRKKIEHGYKVILGGEYIKENQSETVNDSNLDVPECTLALDGTKENHWKKIEREKTVIVQRKIDGNRANINLKTGKIYSRSRKEIGNLPHLGPEVQRYFKKDKLNTPWIDGELYSHDLTFNEIQSIIRKKPSKMTPEDVERAKSIGIIVFDYMQDHEEQFERTWVLELIRKENRQSNYVQILESQEISPSEVKKYHDKFVEEGYEGVIIRLLHDGGYQHKRSNYMYKYKVFFDAEFKVVGFIAEKLRVNERLGAVVMEFNPNHAGKKFPMFGCEDTLSARPAMPDEEKAKIWKNRKEYIGRMATVRFQELDPVSKKPRFPTLKGFRAESDIETGR